MFYTKHYGCNEKAFEEIVCKNIQENKETMEFLKKQALEIFESEKTKFEQQEQSFPVEEREKWEDHYQRPVEELEKYLYNWFYPIKDEVRYQICNGCREKFPEEIISIFENCLDRIFEYVSFQGLAYDIIDDIFYSQMEEVETNVTK